MNQPNRRIIPQLPADTHPQVRDAFRQIYDLAYLQRRDYGPASLLAENAQGQPVRVLTTDTGMGLSVTVTRPGTWNFAAAVTLKLVGDSNKDFTLSLKVNGITQQRKAITNLSADGTVMMHQSWRVTDLVGSESAQVLIRKATAGGTSVVEAAHSSLSATWQGT